MKMVTAVSLLLVSVCLLLITIIQCRWLTKLSDRVNELERR